MRQMLQKYAYFPAYKPRLTADRRLAWSRLVTVAELCTREWGFRRRFCTFRRPPLQPVLRTATLLRCYATKHIKKNHYQVLGISPKASQGNIKDAYYKLSMKHHPDRHKGSEQKHAIFQEIAEAYSVLGNQELRKQYDRGLIVQGALSPEHTRATHAPLRRTGSIYDFDEWTKRHYYQALQRKQRDKKERMDEELERESHKVQEGSQRLMVLLVFLIIVVFFSATERHIHRNSVRKITEIEQD